MNEIEERIAALEKRIEKIEKALAVGPQCNNGGLPDDYEQIIKKKETSAAYYFLTNKGRILASERQIHTVYINPKYNPWYSHYNYMYNDDKYKAELKGNRTHWLYTYKFNLSAIGEDSLFTGESDNDILNCTTALRTKYRAAGALPCLLPNGVAITNEGGLLFLSETSKKIKF